MSQLPFGMKLDPKMPRYIAEIRDFPGIQTKPDPDDLDVGGAVEQTNAISDVGVLRLRDGFVPVSFDAP